MRLTHFNNVLQPHLTGKINGVRNYNDQFPLPCRQDTFEGVYVIIGIVIPNSVFIITNFGHSRGVYVGN